MKKKMSMKGFSRLFNLLLAAVIVMGCACPIAVYAATKYTKSSVEDGWYRILHPASGKYVDVSNVSKENGACLHLWDKAEGNQNQIFHITRNADGTYVIIANHSKKAVEVRNSSMDDYGEVAQWDYGEVSCQQWRITRNEDKTYSFTNANSGLNMSVLKPSDEYSNNQNYSDDLDFASGLVESILRSTGSAIATNEDKEKTEKTYENGTKLIQHHEDDTVDDKFELIKLTDNDILSASWDVDPHDLELDSFPSSEVKFRGTIGLNGKQVLTSYTVVENDRVYFPAIEKKQAVSIKYYGFDTLVETVSNAAYKKGAGEVVEDGVRETGIDLVVDGTAELCPEIGVVYKCVKFIAELCVGINSEEWNRFVKSAKEALHQSKGLYVIECVQTESKGEVSLPFSCKDTEPRIITPEAITEHHSFEYEVFDKKMKTVKGEWEYTFK